MRSQMVSSCCGGGEGVLLILAHGGDDVPQPLLGLGLLDGQIDFPLRGDGEDLHGDLLPLGEVVVDVADKGSGHL